MNDNPVSADPFHYERVCAPKFMKIENDVNSIKDKIDRLCDKVDTIHNKLFVSNGVPSWSQRMHDIEQELKTIKESEKAKKRHFWIIYTTILGTLIPAIGIILWKLVLHVAN